MVRISASSRERERKKRPQNRKIANRFQEETRRKWRKSFKKNVRFFEISFCIHFCRLMTCQQHNFLEVIERPRRCHLLAFLSWLSIEAKNTAFREGNTRQNSPNFAAQCMGLQGFQQSSFVVQEHGCVFDRYGYAFVRTHSSSQSIDNLHSTAPHFKAKR